jgi:hypothetical protein
MLLPYREIVSFVILTITVKWCMDIGARPHVCGVFFNVFDVCLNSSLEDEDRIQSPKRYVLNKNRTMDNVQKHINCIKMVPTLT